MTHSVSSFSWFFNRITLTKAVMLLMAFLTATGGAMAQTLTISTASSSGSGWSISSGTLTVTANSTVNVTDITDALNSGSLAIVGNTSAFTVTISNAITSTAAGSGLTIGSAGNTGTVSVGANLSINGPITIDGGNIVLGGTLTSSQTSAAVTLRSLTNITNTAATTVSTQNGNVLFASNVDDATDGETTNNGFIRMTFGLTVTSNGGNITLGGGNTSGTDYATGNTTAFYTGVRVDAVLNLNSGGGNIIMKGKSPSLSVNDGWGVGFANVTSGASINSGAGTILFDGYSQSTVGNNISGLFFGSAATITTTNESANAMQLIGKATGASGEAWGLESESTLSLIASNDNGGITISTSTQAGTYDVVLRNNTDILAKSGAIQLLGGQSGGSGNGILYTGAAVYIGSKASSAVNSSSSDITIQHDRYSLTVYPAMATSGDVEVRPVSTSFGQDFYTEWFQWNQNGQTMSSLIIGKSGNAKDLYHRTNITVAGPVSFYGGLIDIAANLTSTANGDILLKAITGGYDVEMTHTISKTAGTGTLTIQVHGRIILNDAARITASGSGVLNVVLWSDFDNDNNDGGVSSLGNITTNGGHVWMGGSNSNGGSYTWNGLTVGDGPSIGANGYNANAMDIWGDVITNGGDFLAWAGDGFSGLNGIGVHGYGELVSVGTGDIILITDVLGVTSGGGGTPTLFRHTGGTFTLVPNGGSFPTNPFNYNPYVETLSSVTYQNFQNDFNYMNIETPSTLASFTIGYYDGMLNSGTPVVMSNSSNITFATATTYGGAVNLYGGTIALNANLTSTGGGDISFHSNSLLSVSSARTLTAAGQFRYMPLGTSFTSTVTYPITNLTVSSNGLQLGKSGNTADITFTAAPTQTSGPITVYGGTVTIAENLTTTTSGDISIYSDKPLTVTGSRTATAAGMVKYMPDGARFESAVSYPVGNLTVISNGLQLGKPGNTAALTITGASSSNGPVNVFTGDFTTNASATLTATSSALEVTASGNVTLNAALAGSSTTVNVQGNLQTIGTLTNVNLTGGNAQSLTGTATLNNLTLNKTVATTATITADRQDLTGTLTLTAGTLAAGGKLVLKSTASGTARVAAHATSTGNVTGNVVVERFIPSTGSRKKQWRMLGFPYSAAITPGDVSGIGISYSGAQTMMLFNETNDNGVYGTSGRNGGYAPLTAATDLIPAGRGVATWIYNIDNSVTPSAGTLGADLTISSQGPLNESGASVSMTGLSNNVQGWHLIGNPFASTINWDAIYAASTNVGGTIYRWDPQFEGWTDYNAVTLAVNGNGSKYIESGSAFFIKRSTTGPIDVVIPQSAKDANNAPNLHFTRAPFRLDISGERIGAASTLAGLRLKASGMGNPIPAEAYLDVSKVDATKGWDPKYDGMMMSRSAGVNIYFDGVQDDDFSMQFDAPLTTGEQRYYPLTVTTPSAGETTIEINREGRWSSMHSVALIDQKAGKTILMQGGTLKYTLKLEELKSEGRFLLAINHIKLNADGQLPGFDVKALGNPVTGNTIDLLLTHPTAAAKRWRVVDVMGREAGVGVFATDAGVQHRLAVPGMRNPGVYVLQVEMDNGETQQLRILKQ